VKPEDITAKIRAVLPDAVVELKDLTGTADHWEARVISALFEGKSLMQRHRLINAALADELKGRAIHALTLDVKTPAEIDGSS
jgi:stress-induced morphogen